MSTGGRFERDVGAVLDRAQRRRLDGLHGAEVALELVLPRASSDSRLRRVGQKPLMISLCWPRRLPNLAQVRVSRAMVGR
eukprot:3294895-Pyramimonas_sp.AAC.1